MKTMSRPIADDVIHDILLSLTVKDVLRFRCLSKSLCAKIDSPVFTVGHHQRLVETKTRRRKLVFLNEDFSKHSWIDLDIDNDVHRVIKLKRKPYGCSRIISSCDSLLLLGNHLDDTLVVWNPFTRRLKKLPSYDRLDHEIETYIGFGYDDEDNYKVVFLHPPKAVRVFDVVSNTWSEGVVEIPFDHITNISTHIPTAKIGVFANGALHWLTKNWLSIHVFSFHISKQRFVQTLPILSPSPGRLEPPSQFVFDLKVLDGRLFLVGVDRTSLYLYQGEVAVDKGGSSTWRNVYKINVIGGVGEMRDVEILELSKEGNKILLDYDSREELGESYCRRLCWYDLQRQTYKPVQILDNGNGNGNASHLQYRYRAAVCRESLVSLGDDAQFDGDVKQFTYL